MFSKAFTAAVALAAASVVSAQTHTDCNPLTTTCKADPAFGNSKVDCDFTKGACDDFSVADGTTLTYNGNGAVFTIKGDKDAPTINTGKYIFFGRIDVEVQAAAGKGIVTSAVLQSDDLDEIDWEWVGGDNAQVQTNYYSKGQTETYDRGAYHPVSSPLTSFHTYTVEWTPTAITWSIDGNAVRTLEAANAHGVDGFPQTPMQVKLGTWVGGGPDSPAGTAEWAGGRTDFSQAPFLGYYKSITIVDYAGKDSETSESVKEYIYGDHSGTWQSIKVVGGSGDDSSSSSSSSSSAAATKTHTKAPTSTSTKAAPTTSTHKSEAHTTTSEAAETTTSSGGEGSTPMPTTVSTATQSTGATGTGAAIQPSTTGSGATQNSVAAGIAALAGAVMLAQLL